MSLIAFGDLFTFIRNGMSVKQDKSGDGLPITRIETISNGTIDPNRVGYAGLTLDKADSWSLKPGDILFSHINSVEHIGKCAVYEGDPHSLIHGMNLLCLRPDPKRIDSGFCKWLIRSDEFRTRLSNFINKAVNQASVSIGNLRTIKVQVPSLEEQRRIAAILDQAEALRAKRRQALAKLDTLTQSLFRSMFGEVEPNPRSMRTVLQDLVDPNRPIAYGILMPGEPQTSGVKYVRVADMKDGGIDLSSVRLTTSEISYQYRRSLLKANDLLISIRGHVGRLAAVPAALDGANITQDSARLAINGADPQFICELLRSEPYQRWMRRHTKGAAVKGLNLGDLKMIPLPTPPISEQERFGKEAKLIGDERLAMIESLKKSRILVESLQHRAFRGEL